MIHIDPGQLQSCIGELNALAGETVALTSAMISDVGNTADAEKRYLQLLFQIASTDLPQLIASSASLLGAIRTGFLQQDQRLSQSY